MLTGLTSGRAAAAQIGLLDIIGVKNADNPPQLVLVGG